MKQITTKYDDDMVHCYHYYYYYHYVVSDIIVIVVAAVLFLRNNNNSYNKNANHDYICTFVITTVSIISSSINYHSM